MGSKRAPAASCGNFRPVLFPAPRAVGRNEGVLLGSTLSQETCKECSAACLGFVAKRINAPATILFGCHSCQSHHMPMLLATAHAHGRQCEYQPGPVQREAPAATQMPLLRAKQPPQGTYATALQYLQGQTCQQAACCTWTSRSEAAAGISVASLSRHEARQAERRTTAALLQRRRRLGTLSLDVSPLRRKARRAGPYRRSCAAGGRPSKAFAPHCCTTRYGDPGREAGGGEATPPQLRCRRPPVDCSPLIAVALGMASRAPQSRNRPGHAAAAARLAKAARWTAAPLLWHQVRRVEHRKAGGDAALVRRRRLGAQQVARLRDGTAQGYKNMSIQERLWCIKGRKHSACCLDESPSMHAFPS